MCTQDSNNQSFDHLLSDNIDPNTMFDWTMASDPSLNFNSAEPNRFIDNTVREPPFGDPRWMENVTLEELAEFIRPVPADDIVQPAEPEQPLPNAQTPGISATFLISQPLPQQQNMFMPTNTNALSGNHVGTAKQPLAIQSQLQRQASFGFIEPTMGSTAPSNGNVPAFANASPNDFWSQIETATKPLTTSLRYNSFSESERFRTMKVNQKRVALTPKNDETFPKTTSQIKSYVSLVHKALVTAPTNVASASAEQQRQWAAFQKQLMKGPQELFEQAAWALVNEIILSRNLGVRDHKKAVNAVVHETTYGQLKAVCEVLRQHKAIASGVSVQYWSRMIRLVDSPESVVQRSKQNLRQNAERGVWLAEKRKAEKAQNAAQGQKRTFEFEDDDDEHPHSAPKRPATHAAFYQDLNHDSNTSKPGDSTVLQGFGLYGTPSPSPERMMLNSGAPNFVAVQAKGDTGQDFEQNFQS